MKQIVLVRHATAVKKAPTDFDRGLKKAGRKEARDMSKRLKDMEVKPSLMVSSPADRALETAKIFAKALGYATKKISKRDELYPDPSPKSFLSLIEGLDDKANSVVIFGHDPSLSGFARLLLPDFDTALPKCGVLAVKVEVDSWAKVPKAKCEKEYFVFPADRRAAKVLQDELRRNLGAKIEQDLAQTLADFGIDGGADVRKQLHQFSAKLAKQLARQAMVAPAPATSDQPEVKRP